MTTTEVNFDGLVGPTHNYAGLSHGNVASERNRGNVSRPRDAARQGLAKMAYLLRLGLVQGILPPQERPALRFLRRLGFTGSDRVVIERASRADFPLFASVYSASSMWAANAATVAPSADAEDGRVHFTPANLGSTLHRAIEPEGTARALRRIFAGHHFVHHDPLPFAIALTDEGAANHTRLVGEGDTRGVHLFVYGRVAREPGLTPSRYPARQTREASEAIARLHRLPDDRAIFAQQLPRAIDAGVFHNDVIGVGHRHVLFFSELAFLDEGPVLRAIEEQVGASFAPIRVSERELSLDDAVRSYLFNSQIVTLPSGAMAIIAPKECEAVPSARAVLDRVLSEDNPIAEVHALDVRESMRNGGGPACLRLRVPLTDEELAAVHRPCLLDENRLRALEEWVDRHYREELAPKDLADPALLDESRRALDALTTLLDLGSDFYPFQREGTLSSSSVAREDRS